MPTWATTRRFDKDWKGVSEEDQELFRAAIAKFVADSRTGRFQKGLRVKGVQGAAGIFEMTWAPDGRATFQNGASVREGLPHIIWRRVGRHSVLDRP